MALAESLIAAAVGNMLSTGGGHFLQEVRAGSLRHQGRRNEVFIVLKKGYPPEGEAAQQYLREFIDAEGYSFDLWMRPFGTWYKKFSGRGIILRTEVWVRGPLCPGCHQEQFGHQQRGRIFKRDVYGCLGCGRKLPLVTESSRGARASHKVAKRIKRLVVSSLNA
jgi:hypothetical protein